MPGYVARPLVQAAGKALRKAPKAAARALKAFHGTDIKDLETILTQGLREGSALDFSAGKEWAKEYPVVLGFKQAKKGRYVAHNNYYTSVERMYPSTISVDLDQYSSIGAEEALERVSRLKQQYPKIRWTIKGTPPSGADVTLKNLAKFYEDEFKLPTDEATLMARGEIEDILDNTPRQMYGYTKAIRNMKDYKEYVNWLMAQEG